MRLAPIALALAALVAHAQPSDTPLAIGSQRMPVRVTVGATSLSYAGDDSPSQFVLPISIRVPLDRGVVVRAETAYASASATGADIGGIADVRVVGSMFREVGPGSAVLSLDANLPTGMRKFSAEEAATAYLVGQPFYGFALPTWGQGLNIAPSLAYAVPVSDRAAVGAAVSYRSRGAFEPLDVEGATLNPGGEATFMAGVNLKVDPATVVSVDVSGARYGTDTFGGADYEVGNSVAATAEAIRTRPGLRLRLLGRVGVRSEGAPPPIASVPDARIPFQISLLGEATRTVNPSLTVSALVQGRSYGASEAFGGLTMLDVIAAPQFRLSPTLTLQGRVGATVGSLNGVLIGAGLTLDR